MVLLTDVIAKLANIAKTMRYRFQNKWEEYLGQITMKPHQIRLIPFEKEMFMNNYEYRIKTLKTVSNSFIDGYYAIKSLLEALYKEYLDSTLFKERYSIEDQIKIKYIVAKEILGNLVQYNMMDHETVPLKYNILARNYMILKFNAKNTEEIQKNMNKVFLKTPLSSEKIRDTMEEIANEGLINIEQQNNTQLYNLKDTLELSQQAQKVFNENLAQLITWPTNLWRSFYNIRELNITPGSSIPQYEVLKKVLSRSATQGFSSANFVITSLIKFFEVLHNQ